MCGGGKRGGRNSFPAGTEVLTPSGSVAIESLREGDLVVARNEDTGVSGVFPVTALMAHQAAEVLWLTLESEDGSTTRMGVTANHPLFIAGIGWGDAGELVAGDAIRDSMLKELTVLAVEVDTAPQMVHNLEIADAHTYFAGELEAWGHNGYSRKYAARRVRCKSRKDAYQQAKRAGNGAEPRLDYNDKRGPHYHPNVPRSCSSTPKSPNSHWHFFFPKGR